MFTFVFRACMMKRSRFTGAFALEPFLKPLLKAILLYAGFEYPVPKIEGRHVVSGRYPSPLEQRTLNYSV